MNLILIILFQKLIVEMEGMEHDLSLLEDKSKLMTKDAEMLNMLAAVSGMKTKLKSMKADAEAKEKEIRVHFSDSFNTFLRPFCPVCGRGDRSVPRTRFRTLCGSRSTSRSCCSSSDRSSRKSSPGDLEELCPTADWSMDEMKNSMDSIQFIIAAIKFISIAIVVMTALNLYI